MKQFILSEGLIQYFNNIAHVKKMTYLCILKNKTPSTLIIRYVRQCVLVEPRTGFCAATAAKSLTSYAPNL